MGTRYGLGICNLHSNLECRQGTWWPPTFCCREITTTKCHTSLITWTWALYIQDSYCLGAIRDMWEDKRSAAIQRLKIRPLNINKCPSIEEHEGSSMLLYYGIYYVFCTHCSWGWPRGFLPQANHTATRRNLCKQHSGIPGCHPQVPMCHGWHICCFLNGVTSAICAHPICIMTFGATCLHMCPLLCHNIYFQDQTAFQCILYRYTIEVHPVIAVPLDEQVVGEHQRWGLVLYS